MTRISPSKACAERDVQIFIMVDGKICDDFSLYARKMINFR